MAISLVSGGRFKGFFPNRLQTFSTGGREKDRSWPSAANFNAIAVTAKPGSIFCMALLICRATRYRY